MYGNIDIEKAKEYQDIVEEYYPIETIVYGINTQAAYAFLKRLVKQFDEPKVVVTDKAPSITSAFKKLKEYGFYQGTEHRTIKYLNNLIEQDHRPVKRRNKFYRSLRTA
ncbi:hypothetical protein EfmAA94_31830 (plasmid) [Enterococcus faecium]|nr:hypothetical protein EfmAA94_31830 [Enterococcus faecium]